MHDFTVGRNDFELDGRPVRLLSGALHYFRVHEEQWDHRLAMLRAMGLNCVETYVPWNLHEPRPGEFRDEQALGRFLDAARRSGLWAIVRPGPYICAEWENGGLPHWLTGRLGARCRTRDPEFVAAVERWFRVLLPQVVERQVGRGGPVLMVQVENEYGSYGSDAEYLEELRSLLVECGVSVPLFTSDGPEDHMLTGGSVPGALATVNFGSGAAEAFEVLRRHRPEGPLMCAEFWCGWFDHWGAAAVTRDAPDAAKALREILECGASVNLFMAHGGTSFAGWAGANRGGALHDGKLLPDVTSYDYDAPVDEYGRPTEKFWRFREVLAEYAEYAGGPLPELPPDPGVLAAPARGRADAWVPVAEVLDRLGGPEEEHAVPPSFEQLGVDRGLVRYSLRVPGPRQPYPLRLPGVRDLARVYAEGRHVGTLTEDEPELAAPLPGPCEIDIWVESLGRVNYGPRTGETKGLTGGVLHERQYLHGVRASGLRLDAFEETGAVRALPFAPVPAGPPHGGEAGAQHGGEAGAQHGGEAGAQHGGEAGAQHGGEAGAPGLYRAMLPVSGAGDAVLRLPGWGRGFAWVNGFCLGRYWSCGPQESLFVPGPVLRDGAAEVWVLELEGGGGALELSAPDRPSRGAPA